MGKYISLGEYNQIYKYIWIYLVIRFVTLFIFSRALVFDQLKSDLLKKPDSPFISFQFNYAAFIIISALIKIIEKIRKNKESTIIFNKDEKELIFNKQDIETEYGLDRSEFNLLVINLFLVVISDLLDESTSKFQCSILSYWMFEMLFFELFYYRLLKSNIYKHHIFSFIFILSSCSLIKTIVIILNFANDTDDVQIFNYGKWLIPVGFIYNFLYMIFKAYTFCNEKYYLEKKIISITDYMLLYGIIGFSGSLICALISTLVPCGDNTIPELSKTVCTFKVNGDIYFFDNYKLYFQELSSELLGVKLLFIIIQSTLYYVSTYYSYVIYKKLSPIYHICMYRFNYLILDILGFINEMINDDNIKNIGITISILNILILFFYMFGSIVYLEFIELNFCNLNFYTKRNIKERSKRDIRISLGNMSVNCEIEE